MSTVTDFASWRHELQSIVAADTQCYPIRSQKCSVVSERLSKQRKASKPHIIYRSRASAISTYMEDVLHKSKAGPERCEEQADENEKLRDQMEQHVVPATPALTCTCESAGSRRGSSSPSSSSASLNDFDMPPTPRLRTCELLVSPSIVSSPLLPLRSHFEETNPEPEFHPLSDEPVLRPLSDEWSSFDRTSSLSLASEASDDESWPFNNRLGLYVDPAMNVAAWDAGGFIRSTAPSPSPSRLRSARHGD